MGKLLRLRDYVLFAGAFAHDLLDATRLGWGVVPSAMKTRYGYVPSKYKPASYLSTVSRMLSTGDIRKVVDDKGRPYLELTNAGEKKFKRRFALFLQNKRWDGYFMIVVFDIPEQDKRAREDLRKKLSELGFGMLQKSVWISPYHFEEDMRDFLLLKGLEDEAFVLSAKRLWAGDLKKLAERVWRIERINKRYKKVIKKVKKVRELEKPKRKEALGKAMGLYLDTLSRDPLLPKEFLPDSWSRNETLVTLNNAIKYSL